MTWTGHAITHPLGDELAWRTQISGGSNGQGLRRWLVLQPHVIRGSMATELYTWIVCEQAQYVWTAQTMGGPRSKFPTHVVSITEMPDSREVHSPIDATDFLILQGLAANEIHGETRDQGLSLLYARHLIEHRESFLQLCSYADDNWVRGKVIDLLRRYGDWTIHVNNAHCDAATRAELDALERMFDQHVDVPGDEVLARFDAVSVLLAAALRGRVITEVDFRDALHAVRVANSDKLRVRGDVIQFLHAQATPLQRACAFVRAYAYDVAWHRVDVIPKPTDGPDRAALHALQLIWELEAQPQLVENLLAIVEDSAMSQLEFHAQITTFMRAHAPTPEVVHDEETVEPHDGGFIQVPKQPRRRRAQ